MKKLAVLVGLVIVLGLVLFNVPKQMPSLLPVFQLTEKPAVISKGSYGNTITIDLTFGRDDVEKFVTELQAPYPHFFISIEWIERSEEIIEVMKDKNIPISLLGKNGSTYIENPTLFKKEVKQFEQVIGEKPLWFRTIDYEFPIELQKDAWGQEVNLLSSSKYWSNKVPSFEKGDILSIPLHQNERIDIQQLTKIVQSTEMITIEQNIFGLKVKTKTFPN
ncbi:hypothetical protein SAMN05421670_3154 [Psychrobacillus psychrotolerans]|uniref:Polysaccharide deacetylase n=1 Tax=Psychrobacillus psychrotolerans TaxID=126156 RepID=A0A1I6A8D5_9BACI|nr:hypothetical protein [Psychrobacillus psychrotolerans]SFQ64949.1 hypothetical protein SAMN05421670_3154 [Psychrobacillus psychrotolerans]